MITEISPAAGGAGERASSISGNDALLTQNA
jgi:hypothetical protein